MVLFESPHRLLDLLADIETVLGERPLQVARELTKRHEQQVGPTLSSALAHFRAHSPQGEFTLVLGGAPAVAAEARSEAELLEDLQALLDQGLSRNEAARQLAQQTGLAKRELYALLHHEGEAN